MFARVSDSSSPAFQIGKEPTVVRVIFFFFQRGFANNALLDYKERKPLKEAYLD